MSANVLAIGDTQVLKVKCSLDDSYYEDIIISTYECTAISATSISMESPEGISFTVNDDESFEVYGIENVYVDVYSIYPYMKFAYWYYNSDEIYPINSDFINIDNTTIVKDANGVLSAVASAPSNMVTTDTEQDITGQKTFSTPIIKMNSQNGTMLQYNYSNYYTNVGQINCISPSGAG